MRILNIKSYRNGHGISHFILERNDSLQRCGVLVNCFHAAGHGLKEDKGIIQDRLFVWLNKIFSKYAIDFATSVFLKKEALPLSIDFDFDAKRFGQFDFLAFYYRADGLVTYSVDFQKLVCIFMFYDEKLLIKMVYDDSIINYFYT